MELARSRKDGHPGFFAGFGLLLVMASGCTNQRPWVDRALMALPPGAASQQSQTGAYQVGCPDVLDITLAGPPVKNWKQEIGPDSALPSICSKVCACASKD